MKPLVSALICWVLPAILFINEGSLKIADFTPGGLPFINSRLTSHCPVGSTEVTNSYRKNVTLPPRIKEHFEFASWFIHQRYLKISLVAILQHCQPYFHKIKDQPAIKCALTAVHHRCVFCEKNLQYHQTWATFLPPTPENATKKHT